MKLSLEFERTGWPKTTSVNIWANCSASEILNSDEDNSLRNELRFTLFRGINQMEHEYRSFFNDLRAVLGI